MDKFISGILPLALAQSGISKANLQTEEGHQEESRGSRLFQHGIIGSLLDPSRADEIGIKEERKSVENSDNEEQEQRPTVADDGITKIDLTDQDREFSDVIDDTENGLLENPWTDEEEYIITQDILRNPSAYVQLAENIPRRVVEQLDQDIQDQPEDQREPAYRRFRREILDIARLQSVERYFNIVLGLLTSGFQLYLLFKEKKAIDVIKDPDHVESLKRMDLVELMGQTLPDHCVPKIKREHGELRYTVVCKTKFGSNHYDIF